MIGTFYKKSLLEFSPEYHELTECRILKADF